MPVIVAIIYLMLNTDSGFSFSSLVLPCMGSSQLQEHAREAQNLHGLHRVQNLYRLCHVKVVGLVRTVLVPFHYRIVDHYGPHPSVDVAMMYFVLLT
jgi:hypothetical protein